MRGQTVHYTSNNQEYETPQDLFDKINECYGFCLDAAASAENHKVERYYTKEQNGLVQPWTPHKVWLNPPYNDVKSFMQKAEDEASHGALVVCLLAARTDTTWFHENVASAQQVTFIRGRLHFSGEKNPASFPSMVVTFLPYEYNTDLGFAPNPRMVLWNWKQEPFPLTHQKVRQRCFSCEIINRKL